MSFSWSTKVLLDKCLTRTAPCFLDNAKAESSSVQVQAQARAGCWERSLQDFSSPSTPRHAQKTKKKQEGKRQHQYVWSAINDISINSTTPCFLRLLAPECRPSYVLRDTAPSRLSSPRSRDRLCDLRDTLRRDNLLAAPVHDNDSHSEHSTSQLSVRRALDLPAGQSA